jgi:hypothetical protein
VVQARGKDDGKDLWQQRIVRNDVLGILTQSPTSCHPNKGLDSQRDARTAAINTKQSDTDTRILEETTKNGDYAAHPAILHLRQKVGEQYSKVLHHKCSTAVRDAPKG